MNIMNSPAFSFFIIFLLMLFSAYFAACETAVMAYSKPRIFYLASDGNKKANIILDLQNEIDLVLSSLLTCSTILNASTIAFSTLVGKELFGGKFIFLYSSVQTICIVFFTEILPKMLTIINPEKILIPAAYFIKFIFTTLKPINNILGTCAKQIIKLLKFNISKNQDKFGSSLDELKGAIDLHQRNNPEATAQEKDMLKRILDLESVTVDNIMIHRRNVTTMSIDDPIKVIEQMNYCPFTRIPLWQDNEDNIIGILHAKDLLKIIPQKKYISSLDLARIAIKPWFIPENKTLLSQLQAFKAKREHFALVVDEYGIFMGIVTLEDIIEEIVGEISDEHDILATNGIRLQVNGSYVVNGSVNLRDLNREINANFKNSETATIAGFLINSIGIIPDIGQVFILFKYRFEILRKQRNQITLINIAKVREIEYEN